MSHRIDLTKTVSQRDKTMIRIRLTLVYGPAVHGPWIVERGSNKVSDPKKSVSEFAQMLLTILFGCFICAGLLKLSIMVIKPFLNEMASAREIVMNFPTVVRRSLSVTKNTRSISVNRWYQRRNRTGRSFGVNFVVEATQSCISSKKDWSLGWRKIRTSFKIWSFTVRITWKTHGFLSGETYCVL